MTGAVIANWPIALLIIVAIVGVPLWLTFRRKHVRPNYHDAHAHYAAKEAGTGTGEYGPRRAGQRTGWADRPAPARYGGARGAAPWLSA